MPKHYLLNLTFLFLAIFLASCTCSAPKKVSSPVQDVLPQQKQEVSAMYQECLNGKHGEILNCIQKKVSELEKAVPVLTEPTPMSAWKSSEEYAMMGNPVPADQVSLDKGEETYQFYCSACHGADGKGGLHTNVEYGRKVADLTNPALKDRTDGELFWKITEGGWPMPAFWEGDTLSENDIWMLIHFLRTLEQKG